MYSGYCVNVKWVNEWMTPSFTACIHSGCRWLFWMKSSKSGYCIYWQVLVAFFSSVTGYLPDVFHSGQMCPIWLLVANEQWHIPLSMTALFQGHFFPSVEPKWVLHFKMLAYETWWLLFWSIYHCLTSVTLGFPLDQMRFVHEECWIDAEHS